MEEQEKSSYIYAQAYLYVKISYSGINCGEFSLIPVLSGYREWLVELNCKETLKPWQPNIFWAFGQKGAFCSMCFSSPPSLCVCVRACTRARPRLRSQGAPVTVSAAWCGPAPATRYTTTFPWQFPQGGLWPHTVCLVERVSRCCACPSGPCLSSSFTVKTV